MPVCPPGSYRFSGPPGPEIVTVLISQPAVFEFRILPPIYLRWWFHRAGPLIVVSSAIAFSLLTAIACVSCWALGAACAPRIATDLHDDIGGQPSRGVAILSEVERQQNRGHNAESEGRLAERSPTPRRELVDSMSDIVWSVDPPARRF